MSVSADPARLRIVFAGTPDFAVPCLAAIASAGAEVVAVYTQPDRPAGRGRRLTGSPVKQAAERAHIPVEQPPSLRGAETQQALAAYRPDLLVVVAYGLILPRAVLDLPVHGCWNVHASLLPRWRGAAPIQRAILAGDAQTGVTLMHMDAGLDTGPMLLARASPIRADDTGGSVHDRLAALGADVLREGLEALIAGRAPAPRAQETAGAVYAHKLEKAESRLDFTRSAAELERAVRAFDPWPGTTADMDGEVVHVLAAQALDTHHASAPGGIVSASRAGIDLACSDGVLRVTALKRAGGRRITAADYLNARPALRQMR